MPRAGDKSLTGCLHLPLTKFRPQKPVACSQLKEPMLSRISLPLGLSLPSGKKSSKGCNSRQVATKLTYTWAAHKAQPGSAGDLIHREKAVCGPRGCLATRSASAESAARKRAVSQGCFHFKTLICKNCSNLRHKVGADKKQNKEPRKGAECVSESPVS